jgi:hypothetical protein
MPYKQNQHLMRTDPTHNPKLQSKLKSRSIADPCINYQKSINSTSHLASGYEISKEETT